MLVSNVFTISIKFFDINKLFNVFKSRVHNKFDKPKIAEFSQRQASLQLCKDRHVKRQPVKFPNFDGV